MMDLMAYCLSGYKYSRTIMAIRKIVNCSECSKEISRVFWNYAKNREIATFFCDTKCKAHWQIKQRESLGFTKEWLIDEYCVKNKSANQIAREIKRDPKRVWEWIRNYGLETRPRGTDYGQCFKSGQESVFKGMRHSEDTKNKARERRLKDGHVPYLKDGIHWLKHDGAISPNWRGGVTPERQSFYSSEGWKNAVKKVWERDNAICQKCGKNHNKEGNRGSFHIHHIISFAVKELRSDINNLVLLCKECHRWVHSKGNIEKAFLNNWENK